MTTIATISILFSAYLFFFVFATNTKKFVSALWFKFLPFLIAVWLLGIGLSLFSVIQTPLTPKVNITEKSK